MLHGDMNVGERGTSTWRYAPVFLPGPGTGWHHRCSRFVGALVL